MKKINCILSLMSGIVLTLITRYVLFYIHEIGHGVAFYFYAWLKRLTTLNLTLGYQNDFFDLVVPSSVKSNNIFGYNMGIAFAGVISTTLFMFFIYLLLTHYVNIFKIKRITKILEQIVLLTFVSQFLLNLLLGVDLMYYFLKAYELNNYWNYLLVINFILDWLSLFFYIFLFYKLFYNLFNFIYN